MTNITYNAARVNKSIPKLTSLKTKNNSIKKEYNTARVNHKDIKSVENINVAQNSKKSNKSFFDWIKGAINPLNHLPIVGTVMGFIKQDQKDSTSMGQSLVGGLIYGGPFGMLTGIGGWIAKNILFNKKVEENVSIKNQEIEDNSNIKNENIEEISNNILLNKKLEENVSIKNQKIKDNSNIKNENIEEISNNIQLKEKNTVKDTNTSDSLNINNIQNFEKIAQNKNIINKPSLNFNTKSFKKETSITSHSYDIDSSIPSYRSKASMEYLSVNDKKTKQTKVNIKA